MTKRSLLFWALCLAFCTIALVCLGRYLHYISAILPFSYDWEPTDGDHLNFAHRLAQGLPIYLSLKAGQVLSIYTPLYHGLIALFGGSHASLNFARSVSFLFWLIIPFTVFFAHIKRWGYSYSFIAAIFIWLPIEPGLLLEIVQVSPSSTMAFLFLCSLLYAESLSENDSVSSWSWIIMGSIAALCYLAKQQGIIAIACVVTFLLIKRTGIRNISLVILGFMLVFVISTAYLEFMNSGQYLRSTLIDLNNIMKPSFRLAGYRLFTFLIHNLAFTICVFFALFSLRLQFRTLSIWDISIILHVPFLLKILGNGGGGPTYFLTFWITIVLISMNAIKKYEGKLVPSEYFPNFIKKILPDQPLFSKTLLICLCVNISIGTFWIHRDLNAMTLPTTKLENIMRDYYQSVGSLIATNKNPKVLTNRNVGALVAQNVNIDNEGSTMFQYAWVSGNMFDRSPVLTAIREKKYDFITTGIQDYPADVKKQIEANYRVALLKEVNLMFGKVGFIRIYTLTPTPLLN